MRISGALFAGQYVKFRVTRRKPEWSRVESGPSPFEPINRGSGRRPPLPSSDRIDSALHPRRGPRWIRGPLLRYDSRHQSAFHTFRASSIKGPIWLPDESRAFATLQSNLSYLYLTVVRNAPNCTYDYDK